MKSYIRTVCGDILIDQIKNVLIHEHIIWNIIQPNNNILQNPINLENRWQTNYETDLNAENSHQYIFNEIKKTSFSRKKYVKLFKISKKQNLKVMVPRFDLKSLKIYFNGIWKNNIVPRLNRLPVS